MHQTGNTWGLNAEGPIDRLCFRFRITIALLLFLLLSGCGPASSRPLPLASTRDEIPANIRLVSASPTLPPTPPAAATLTPAPRPTAPSSPAPLHIAPTTYAISSGPLELAQVQYSPWDLVLALAWSPEGDILAVSAGERIHLVDPGLLNEIHAIDVGVWPRALAFSPDGMHLAAALQDGRLLMWDIPASGEGIFSEQPRFSVEAHRKGANSVAFSPDGRYLASGGNDGFIRLWDSQDGQLAGEIIGGSYAVPAVAFTPQANLLALVNHASIRLMEAETQRLVRGLWGEVPVFSIAFSPDGRWLAAGEAGGAVRLWDPQTGEEVRVLKENAGKPSHPGWFFWSLAFSPDGEVLAGASSSGDIAFWKVETGAEDGPMVTLPAHSGAASSLAFSPRGDRLATGGLDARLRLWDLAP